MNAKKETGRINVIDVGNQDMSRKTAQLAKPLKKIENIPRALVHQLKARVHLKVDQGLEVEAGIKRVVLAIPNQMIKLLEVIVALLGPVVVLIKRKNSDI